MSEKHFIELGSRSANGRTERHLLSRENGGFAKFGIFLHTHDDWKICEHVMDSWSFWILPKYNWPLSLCLIFLCAFRIHQVRVGQFSLHLFTLHLIKIFLHRLDMWTCCIMIANVRKLSMRPRKTIPYYCSGEDYIFEFPNLLTGHSDILCMICQSRTFRRWWIFQRYIL